MSRSLWLSHPPDQGWGTPKQSAGSSVQPALQSPPPPPAMPPPLYFGRQRPIKVLDAVRRVKRGGYGSGAAPPPPPPPAPPLGSRRDGRTEAPGSGVFPHPPSHGPDSGSQSALWTPSRRLTSATLYFGGRGDCHLDLFHLHKRSGPAAPSVRPPQYPPPPLFPCPSYSRRRDRNNCVRNLITYEM